MEHQNENINNNQLAKEFEHKSKILDDTKNKLIIEYTKILNSYKVKRLF